MASPTRLLHQFQINRAFMQGGLYPPNQVVGQSLACDYFTFGMEIESDHQWPVIIIIVEVGGSGAGGDVGKLALVVGLHLQ